MPPQKRKSASGGQSKTKKQASGPATCAITSKLLTWFLGQLLLVVCVSSFVCHSGLRGFDHGGLKVLTLMTSP